MPELITLQEDGQFGKAGDQVWVDDPADAKKEPVKSKRGQKITPEQDKA